MNERIEAYEHWVAVLSTKPILELREMAAREGIGSTKKSVIVNYFADKNAEAEPVAPEVTATATATATKPEPKPEPVASPPSEGEAINWPRVPLATSEVNGDYVEPPWLDELKAAATIGHVELSGPAGSGKTLGIHHLAASLGKSLAVVTADGGLRKRDLIGQRELINGSSVFNASEFAAAARNGDWALIDEANMAEADAMAFINGMTDRPAIEGSTFTIAGTVVNVHPNFRCFITNNPGLKGTKILNEALRDRFWTIEVPPLKGKALISMLRSHDIDDEIASESAAVVDALYKAHLSHRVTYQVSPRRALAAAKMFKVMPSKGKYSRWLFREVITKSILTKIDDSYDKDNVKDLIETVWQALDAKKKN